MGLAQIASLKKRAIKLINNNKIYRKKLSLVKEIRVLDFNFSDGEVPLWTDVFAYRKRDKLIEYLKKMASSVESFGIRCIFKNHLNRSIKNLKFHLQYIKNYFGYHHH